MVLSFLSRVERGMRALSCFTVVCPARRVKV